MEPDRQVGLPQLGGAVGVEVRVQAGVGDSRPLRLAESTARSFGCPLFERRDLTERLLSPSPLPVLEEFLSMQSSPLDHKAQYARRQPPAEDRQSSDIDQRNAVPVLRMEVRWIVIFEEYLDHDAEEPADLRHGQLLDAIPGKRLQASCQSP